MDYIDESVKIRDQIGKSEIKDIQTVISSLDDDSFKDFKFIDLVYCDIRYKSKKPIAFLTIRAKMINNSMVGYVSLAVNPKYQNQGIGKSLATKAVSWFKKERGIQFLEWHCLQDNEASRKLANSTGFREYIARNEDEYARFTMESSCIEEGYVKDSKDVYYNKDKFNSGEINICFITGLSGSGKSTMGRSMSSKDIEHYEMDDVICNDNFSDTNLKEYGGLIESFFKGPGKSFRLIKDDDKNNDEVFNSHKNYEKEITQAFVKHAISYCKSHPKTKYVCDGIWIFMFIKPETLKDCAVYIKGTSSLKSGYRALKRDIDEDKRNGMNVLQIFKHEFRRVKEDVLYARENQKELRSFMLYFQKNSTNESYIEEFELPKRPDEQKVSEEILDTVKPIILTSQNKSKAFKLGLDLKCEITEVDSGMVFILVLDGPQEKRDTEEARSLLKDLASKCRSKLSDIVSKVDIGDGDEGCLFFTMDKGKIRRKRKDLLESYVEEKFHMMSNPYRKKVIKNLNQYDHIFSKYGSNYKDQRDKEVGKVSGNLSTDKVGNFFVNHFDNDKKGISPGISYWCYKSITSGSLDKLKSDIHSLNREIKSKGIKFDLYGINPNEKIQKYVWVFLYFLDNRRKSLDESYTVEIEESYIEEDAAIIAAGAFLALFYGGIAAARIHEKIKPYLDERKFVYDVYEDKIRNYDYGYKNPKDAVVAYAKVLKIKSAEKGVLLYKDKSVLKEKVKLYKFNKKKETHIIFDGTYEELCEKYNIELKPLDDSKIKDRDKVYKQTVSLVKKELSKYPIFKKGGIVDNDDEYDSYISGMDNYIEIYYASLFDLVKNPRSDEGREIADKEVWKPLNKIIKSVNDKLPKGYRVTAEYGDWDDVSIDLEHNVKLNESTVEEDVEQEFSPSSFVKRSSLPAKNQKNHTQYLRKKAHSNKTNNATAQSELPKFNQIGELSFEEVAKGVRVKPIFIVTSYTNTPFGKAIKTFTHAQYTHAAISFDTSLEQLYSFNADPKVTTNGNKGGISRESLSEYINTYDKAIIQVNCILCKESDFNIVKNTLDDIFRKESDTRYGYMNILNILIGRAKDTGMSMVCSQFVSYILHKADIKLVDKPDNLVEPKDLSTIVNPRVYKLYEGAAKDYDKKKIDRIFRKLKTKALLIKESLLEYCV